MFGGVQNQMLFAVLEGLMPLRLSTRQRQGMIGDHVLSWSGPVLNSPLPRWRTPYDFSAQKKEFLAFNRIYQLIEDAFSTLPRLQQQSSRRDRVGSVHSRTITSTRHVRRSTAGMLNRQPRLWLHYGRMRTAS